MAKTQPQTSIGADGRRYVSKKPGSPFSTAGMFDAATMSCFLCGKHRPRSALKSRKMFGKTQFVCAPNCAEAAAERKA
jgi:hypothetical protein